MASIASQLANWWRWLTSSAGADEAPNPTRIAGHGVDEAADARLARLSRWCATGRRGAAELELAVWRRKADCPSEAIALLAGLFAQTQRHAEAIDVLQSALRRDEHNEPVILGLLIALHTVTDHAALADELTAQLHREHGQDTAAMRWLTTIRPTAPSMLPAVSDATIEQLAGELLDHADAIPSLVAAQRIEKSARTIHMLRGAIAHMLRDLEGERATLIAYHALADLAMLDGDADDARRWAHRGLRLDPYSASFALVLSRVDDDLTLGPPASSVLADAVNAHPKFPDLRAALIRREFAEGRIDIAKRRLHQWLQREPNQPMAIRLNRELAA